MMPRYGLIPVGQTPEQCRGLCEWGTFLIGYDCRQPMLYALVDTVSADWFHAAHLCDEHAGMALALSNGLPIE
jgi:hypothetical protein